MRQDIENCRLMKTRNRRHPRSSEMVMDKSGKSGAFLFSRRVLDFCDDRRFSQLWDGRETENCLEFRIGLKFEDLSEHLFSD